MPILGKIKERTAMDAAKVSDPRQLILNAPSFDHKGYVEKQNTEAVQPTTTMGDVAFNNTAKPVLEKWDPEKMAESQRNNYMQSFNTWADAEKAGDISQKDWANARIQKMIAEGKNPGEFENILSLYGDAETPEEKRKRERREALGETFRGLGNLIGNAANLYYTHRGGQYIDLNSVNEKHRARMQQIKDKQDALDEQRKQMLIRAKMGEIQAARAEAAKKEEREYNAQVEAGKTARKAKDEELKYQRELVKLQIQNAHKLGQIDAETKAKLLEQAERLKNEKALEAFKQQNRLELNDAKVGNKKSTFTYGGTAYDKKSLSSMVALYNKLRQDGYAMPKVKGRNVNEYISAISNSMSQGTYNIGDFSKGAEAKYPNIIDSDMNQGEGYGVLAWKGEDETNKTYWD